MYVLGGTTFDDAIGAGVRWRFVDTSETSSTRRINFNSDGITAHADQQAFLVFNGGADPLATATQRSLGRLRCLTGPFECYPNIVGIKSVGDYQNSELDNNVAIYESTIRAQTPTSNSPVTPDSVDDEVIRSVIAHELGHGIGIAHNADLSSIMREETVYDNDWSSIMHEFLMTDLVQVRLK
jgi:hypothetical protein